MPRVDTSGKGLRGSALTLAVMAGLMAMSKGALAQLGPFIVDGCDQVNIPSDEVPRIESDYLVVGEYGRGVLNASGQNAFITTFNARIGDAAGSDGIVTISDGARMWNYLYFPNTSDPCYPPCADFYSGSLDVGNEGKGVLSVLDGGWIESADLVVGRAAGSEGLVRIAGTDARVSVVNGISVGGGGRGTLIVENGGTLDYFGSNPYQVQATLYIGGTGQGDVTVRGQGSSVRTEYIAVGSGGVGTLTIEDGGVVSATREVSAIGKMSGGRGDVRVTGLGSVLSVAGLDVGYAGTGTITLSEGGTLSGGRVVLGREAGASGTLNIGASEGQAAASAGNIDVSWIDFGEQAVSAILNFNHTETDYSFATDLRGKGTINQIAGNTRLAGNGAAFSGTTNISGGELRVDGTLGGTLFVRSGGRLSGAGTVGTTTVGAGATIAPGNSIGTLNVNGDIRFEAGSIYEIEASPQGPDSDLIKVTGTATLAGGSVLHVGPGGNFKPGVVYTILNADGGVDGRFDNVLSNFAFLAPSLSYDASHVYLGLVRNQIEFADYARTRNQKTVASGIVSAAAGHVAYDTVTLLPDNGDLVRRVYDNLSGESHASVKTAMLDDSRFVREAALDRAAAMGGGEIWASFHGSSGRLDGDDNASRMDRQAHSVLIGADRALSDSWGLGLVAGSGRSELDVDARGSSATVDGYTLAAYAGMRVDGLGARFGVAYGWNDVDSTRRIDIPGLSETVKAKYDVNTAQAFAEAGYRIDRGHASVEPFLRLAYVKIENDPYRESGRVGLIGERERQDTAFATLGVRADKSFALGSTAARLHGTLGWRLATEEIAMARHAFSAGEAFTVAGAPLARKAAVIELGLSTQASERVEFGLDYSGQIASDARDHGLQAKLEVRFQ